MIRLKVSLLSYFLVVISCDSKEDELASATPLTDFSAPFNFGLFELPPDNPLTEEGVELGRMLFYEVRLSLDSSLSCATCHQQSKAFTDGRKLGVGIGGQNTDRNTMSLVNLLWSSPLMFWDGRAENLEDQALHPIEDPGKWVCL